MTVPDEIDDNMFDQPLQPVFALFETDWTTQNDRPQTPLQALMEAGPSDNIQTSYQDVTDLAAIIQDALQTLDARSRYVIDAITFEGITYAELAERMSISSTHAHRLHEQALDDLKHELMNSELVLNQLGHNTTWSAALFTELVAIAGVGEHDERHPRLKLDEANDIIQIYENQLHPNGIVRNVHLLTRMAETAVDYLRTINRWNIRKHHQLIVTKHEDYGQHNILKHGIPGICVRISDKTARLDNLVKNGKAPRNETVTDTFYDIIGYAALARMILNETFDLE